VAGDDDDVFEGAVVFVFRNVGAMVNVASGLTVG